MFRDAGIDILNFYPRIPSYYYAFCDDLKGIFSISHPVTEIGRGAFSYCHNLTSVQIPNTVKKVEEQVFSGSGVQHITIPDNVTDIGRGIFSYCENLTSVHLSDSITIIPEYAFCGCFRLISVNIPSIVASIEDSAFNRCRQLKTLDIPESVVTIGPLAFFDCDSLASIEIPDSADAVSINAFDRYSGTVITNSRSAIKAAIHSSTASYETDIAELADLGASTYMPKVINLLKSKYNDMRIQQPYNDARLRLYYDTSKIKASEIIQFMESNGYEVGDPSESRPYFNLSGGIRIKVYPDI